MPQAGITTAPGRGAPLARPAHLVKRAQARHDAQMSENSGNPTREERLAAKLRENLRRRKTQARALSGGESSAADTGQDALSKAEEDR
ncbi:MAG: hypothetical protein RLZZ08_267 [Pseudomonadota bacterium]